MVCRFALTLGTVAANEQIYGVHTAVAMNTTTLTVRKWRVELSGGGRTLTAISLIANCGQPSELGDESVTRKTR